MNMYPVNVANTLEKYTSNLSIYWQLYIAFIKVLCILKNTDVSDSFHLNFNLYKKLLNELVLENNNIKINPSETTFFPLIQRYFLMIPTLLFYLQDKLQETRFYLNKYVNLYEKTLIKNYQKFPNLNRDLTIDRPLRIGYISHNLRRHSVGWLVG